jgi:hypothetical protein
MPFDVKIGSAFTPCEIRSVLINKTILQRLSSSDAQPTSSFDGALAYG